MPMRKRLEASMTSAARPLTLVLLPDVELQLPALRAVARDAPDFERADLRHARLKADGQDRVLLAVHLQRDFERAQLFDLVAPVLDDGTYLVGLAHRRAEEAELGGLADDEAELAPRDRGLRPLLHAEGHDAQSLERGGQPRHGRHGALDADVIGAGRAAADADAAPALGPAVVGRAARDGVVEVGRFEHAAHAQGLEAFGLEPRVEHRDDALAQHAGLHHAAVEEDVCRAGEAARAAADGVRPVAARLLREEAREVFRDGGVGRVRQPQLLKPDAPLTRRHLVAPDGGEEAVGEDALKVFAAQLRLDRPADELRALAEQRDRLLLALRLGEQFLLRQTALVPEPLQLPRVHAVALLFEALLQQPRER